MGRWTQAGEGCFPVSSVPNGVPGLHEGEGGDVAVTVRSRRQLLVRLGWAEFALVALWAMQAGSSVHPMGKVFYVVLATVNALGVLRCVKELDAERGRLR